MSYQEGVGSKKGGGGVASESQFNVQRRQKVESLLQGNAQVQYTYQQNNEITDNESKNKSNDKQQGNTNPYIFKNHSGKLVCKLCNTLHMSWSSVERHLQGKKHGLNVLRRQQLDLANNRSLNDMNDNNDVDLNNQELNLQKKIDDYRNNNLKSNNITPKCHIVSLKDDGLLVKVDYQLKHYQDLTDSDINLPIDNLRPIIRIMNGYEISDKSSSQDGKGKEKNDVDLSDKKFIVVSNPPFDNISIDIPPNKQLIGLINLKQENCLDEINENLTFWDPLDQQFYIQCKLIDTISN